VNQLPKDVDGVLFLTGGSNTVAALKAYLNFGGKIEGKAMGGSSVLDPTAFGVGQQLAGLVGGSPVPLGGTTPEWTDYVDGFEKVYPKVAAESLFTVLYYDGREAIIQGLEQTDGDLGGNEESFRKALDGLSPEFPNGSVKLDENRNSIQPAYVVEVVDAGGKLGFEVKNEISDVDETFGGLFGADSPPPSRDAPGCEKGKPPPWAS
jgi:branched-chain amino acid transport system substrate-binding protein